MPVAVESGWPRLAAGDAAAVRPFLARIALLVQQGAEESATGMVLRGVDDTIITTIHSAGVLPAPTEEVLEARAFLQDAQRPAAFPAASDEAHSASSCMW